MTTGPSGSEKGKKPKASMKDDGVRDSALLAVALLTDAKTYLKAARELIGAQSTSLSPQYFLLCHSIELILKSYLASHGATERELRGLGHNLLRAYARSRKKDFIPSDARMPDFIRWMSPFHKDLDFRYRQKTGLVQLPVSNELADVVSVLIRQIEPVVRRRFRSKQGEIASARL